MSTPTDPSNRVIPAQPDWLDLPPGYLVQDWIRWQKGKLVAAKLRAQPELIEVAKRWLTRDGEPLDVFDREWLALLNGSVERVATLLEQPDDEGQSMRSGMPFKGLPFVSPTQMESIRERAYGG